MSKKKGDIEIEGYIPYMLGGALIGAVALNYLTNNNHNHNSLSFATTNTSTENEHPVHHHSSSSSHPTHHHTTTTHPAHRSSSQPRFQEEGAHRPHSPRHTTSSSPAHHNHEHATFLHTHPNHTNDDDGFGFHHAEGFGGGFGGGGRGGGGGAGFGGHGGMGGFGDGGMGGHFSGGFGPRSITSRGGAAEFGHDIFGDHNFSIHGFGHDHSDHQGRGGNRHHHGGQDHGDHTGTHGGHRGNQDHQGRGGNRHHHGHDNLDHNAKGERNGGAGTHINSVAIAKPHSKGIGPKNKDGTFNQPTDQSQTPYSPKEKVQNKPHPTDNPTPDINKPSNVDRLYPTTGKSIGGDQFGVDYDPNYKMHSGHNHPSGRFVGYQNFRSFEATSYIKVGKDDGTTKNNAFGDKSAHMFLEAGGPGQSNDVHGCCNYILGINGDGSIIAHEEGDHVGHPTEGKLQDDGIKIGNVGAVKPGETIGLKMALMRDLKGSDNGNHVRLVGFVDRNNNGNWQKFYDRMDPSGVDKQGHKYPVLTDISMPTADGKVYSWAQEMRSRTDQMGQPTQYPNWTEVHEIDSKQLDNFGNVKATDVTLPPVPPNHPKTAPHGIPTGNGNVIGSTGGRNTSPLSTSHINTPSSGGYHGPPIHITAAGGGGIGAAGVGDLLSNIHNTTQGTSIRPPSTTTPRRGRDLGAGAADFYNQVSRDISRTPTPIRQHHTAVGDFYNFIRDEIEGPSNPNTSRLPSITGDFYNHVNDEISHMPHPRHPTNTEDSYTYFDPDTGRVLGISNAPLTDTELYSNLAKSDDNKSSSTTTDLIAMGALIGVPLVLLMAFL